MLQHSVLRAADLDAERQVILEEINQHEDDPGDLVHDLFTETLWPGHPLGRPILGTKQSIEAAGRDQVRRFYRKHYVAGNVVVVAAGNLRHEELLELVGRAHGTGLRARRGPERLEPASRGRRPDRVGTLAGQEAHDRTGAHLRRHQRPVADRPGPVRVRRREQRAGRRDELPAVPGGPGEAGTRVQRLLVPRDVRRGGRVLRLRRHHARAREGGPRDHASRARGRRRARASAPASSNAPRAT